MNLLFDLDDTLYPEKQYIFQGFWAVAQFLQSKYEINGIELYLEFVSIFKEGSNKIFDDFLYRENIAENSFKLVNVYRNAKRKLSLYPDVLSTLKSLRNFGNKLVLVTNGRSETQKEKIKILKIEDYFDDIFILDDFGKEHWKPSVLIFNKIYNEYKGNLTDYLFIGNGQEDLEFSKNAKIKFIFVDRKDSIKKADIRNEQGVCVVKNLKEVIKLIEEERVK